VSFIQCHGKYVQFTCVGTGTTTEIGVKEECDDAACGTCETTETKTGDGKCYVEGTKAHVATCGGTTTATVQIWAAGTACGAGGTPAGTAAPAGAAADTDTYASGVCQIDDHGYVTPLPKKNISTIVTYFSTLISLLLLLLIRHETAVGAAVAYAPFVSQAPTAAAASAATATGVATTVAAVSAFAFAALA
jgi:hypothetical protein